MSVEMGSSCRLVVEKMHNFYHDKKEINIEKF